MDHDQAPQDLFAGVGVRIARDLAEQAARRPRDAAAAAGCTTDQQIAAWLRRHRPEAAAVPASAAG